MSHASLAAQQSMLEEYAAELTPSSEDIASLGGVPPPHRSMPPMAGPRSMHSAAAPAAHAAAMAPNMDTIMRIPVTVRIVLGSATMPVANLVKLGRGAIVPLDRKVGEPVDVVVNGRTVAKGEVVVVDEATSRFGIKLTEVVGPSADAERTS
jgi:flagellar motor switch protein FliN